MHTMIRNRKHNEGCPLNAGRLIVWGLAVTTVVSQVVPNWSEKLQWSRGDGLGVTWLTCHLCHWSWDHLLWDLFAFVLLSVLALRLCPFRFGVCLLVAGLLIPLEVQLNQMALVSYRGLSGIDCALLGLVVSALWQSDSGEGGSSASRFLALLAAAGFIVKTCYELLTGATPSFAPPKAMDRNDRG